MDLYSVLLLYPKSHWPLDDCPETYFEHTVAVDPEVAAVKVQIMASKANGWAIDFQDFLPLAVFKGHLHLELGVMDFF